MFRIPCDAELTERKLTTCCLDTTIRRGFSFMVRIDYLPFRKHRKERNERCQLVIDLTIFLNLRFAYNRLVVYDYREMD